MIQDLDSYRANPSLGPQDKVEASLEAIIGTMSQAQIDDISRNPNIQTEDTLRDAFAVHALAGVMKDEKSPLRVPLTALIVDSYHSPENRFRRTESGELIMLDEDGHFMGLQEAKIGETGQEAAEYINEYSQANLLTGPFKGEVVSPGVFRVPVPSEAQVKNAIMWNDVPFRPDTF